MNKQEDILEEIIEIEQKFPVNTWKVNGVMFWPYIRTSLAYTQRPEKSIAKTKTNKQVRKTILINYFKISYKIPFHIYQLIVKLKQSKRIFTGANSHRRLIKGKKRNIYFDKAVEKFEEDNENSIILDFAKSINTNDLPHSNSVFSLPTLYYFMEMLNRLFRFKKKRYQIELDGYDDFYNHIFEIFSNDKILKAGFHKGEIIRKMKTFNDRRELLVSMLKKTKITHAYFLCYYSAIYYPLIAACNQLNIKTTDIQHGSIGRGHWSYDRWSCIPNEGYQLLPAYFWTWNNYCNQLINNWASKTTFHKGINFGTPWTSDYTISSNQNPELKDYILFNMASVTIERYIADVISYFGNMGIKTVLRLHPRQIHLKDKVLREAEDFGLLHFVTIQNSNEILLINAIQYSYSFISVSSGSIIEAINFGIKPILIPSVGFQYFEDYVESGDIIPVYNRDSKELIKTIENNPISFKGNKNFDSSQENPFLEFERLIENSNSTEI